jgi:hypothetical protein
MKDHQPGGEKDKKANEGQGVRRRGRTREIGQEEAREREDTHRGSPLDETQLHDEWKREDKVGIENER